MRSRLTRTSAYSLQNDDDDFCDMLSDSDVEDEAIESSSSSSLHLATTTSHQSDSLANPQESSPPAVSSNEQEMELQPEEEDEVEMGEPSGATVSGEGHAETAMEEEPIVPDEVIQAKRDPTVSSGTTPTPGGTLGMGPIAGPRKTKVMIRDAAWSTWWAVLYWVS